MHTLCSRLHDRPRPAGQQACFRRPLGVARTLLTPPAMKTLSLLLGASLLLAPALARAEEPLPAPVVGAPAPVYFVPSWAPAAPREPRLAPTQRRSTGLMIGGIALASLGTASLIGGAVMLDQASHTASCSEELCFPQLESGLQRTGGMFFTINGGLMVAGGVAMAIAGGWQVPVRTGASGSLPAAPSVAVGPGNASLKWTF